MEQEQLQEVEALEAIYPDEFELIAKGPVEWSVRVAPHQDGSEENHGKLARALKCINEVAFL